MKPRRHLLCAALWGLFPAAVFGIAGSAPQAAYPVKSDGVPEQKAFPNVALNGQPAQFYLDTGSNSAWLTEDGAKKLGIKFQPVPRDNLVVDNWGRKVGVAFSEPVRLSVDGVNSTVQLIVSGLGSEDGYFGWPEVKDNILRFDGGNRTVSTLDRLPPDLSGWMKLKVTPGNLLVLETTMPDGTTGKILVDTGAPCSVVLSKARWQEWHSAWKAAHPILSGLDGENDDEMARQLALGSLNLSNVWVHGADTGNSIAVIGRFGLTRLDLIVDGKNAAAYLRLRPGIGPIPIDWVWDHWMIQGRVPVNVAPMLIGSGDINRRLGNYTAAIADYTGALALEPKNFGVLTRRAWMKFLEGDTPGALADANRVLELDPKSAGAVLDRGVFKQTLGDEAGALADYDKDIELAPEDSSYARLYRQVLQLRRGQPDADFPKNVAGWKDGWSKTLGRFVAGQLDEPTLLAAAQKSGHESVNERQCQAYYFIGLMRLLHRDPAGARDFFQKSVDAHETELYAYHFSRAELDRLNASVKP